MQNDIDRALMEIPTDRNIIDTFNFYTIPELTEEERTPPPFFVDGLIPVGLTFLAGAPKIRKSFLVLQMGIAIATGQPFFGLDTLKSDVAYFDMEGSKSRAAARARNMSTPAPYNLLITNDVQSRLADGELVEQIRQLHRQNGSIRVFIIDTYSCARGNVKGGSANAYDQDVALLSPIQRMAIEEKIAVIFVHHDKKGAGMVSDDFERLSGTMGISGSSDCVINLIAEGKRFDGQAKLIYSPRDARGGEMSLVFDNQRQEWMKEPDRGKPDLRGNPICNWILCNAPERGHEGVFKSYVDVAKGAYQTYMDKPSVKVIEQVKANRAELFSEYGIGIQLGVKSNGTRGVRIINLQ